MSDRASIELLRRLCLAAGPPGAEDEVRSIVREALDGLGTLSYDRLGSVLCERRGSSGAPRVLLDSHLDEVAFMVQGLAADGRIGFVTLGSWWEHVLLGQRVEILTGAGTRVPGVIGAKPPHFLGAQERKQVLDVEALYVDVGASSRAQVAELGVRVGDPIVPRSEFLEMGVDGILGCKALDNRLGVALMIETLQELASSGHPNTVIGVAAAQEEVGCRGAGTASALARPDVAVVLECAPADDLPGVENRQAALGAGAQIRFFDPTAIAHRGLARLAERIAAESRIAFQLAVRRSGGTDASKVHVSGTGVPTLVIGVPARYIHSHFGLFAWRDYAAARGLTVALLKRLDERTVSELTSFA